MQRPRNDSIISLLRRCMADPDYVKKARESAAAAGHSPAATTSPILGPGAAVSPDSNSSHTVVSPAAAGPNVPAAVQAWIDPAQEGGTIDFLTDGGTMSSRVPQRSAAQLKPLLAAIKVCISGGKLFDMFKAGSTLARLRDESDYLLADVLLALGYLSLPDTAERADFAEDARECLERYKGSVTAGRGGA